MPQPNEPNETKPTRGTGIGTKLAQYRKFFASTVPNVLAVAAIFGLDIDPAVSATALMVLNVLVTPALVYWLPNARPPPADLSLLQGFEATKD